MLRPLRTQDDKRRDNLHRVRTRMDGQGGADALYLPRVPYPADHRRQPPAPDLRHGGLRPVYDRPGRDAGITLRTSDLLCPYLRKGEIRSFRSRAAVDRPGRAMRHPCKTHNEPAFLQNVELYHLVGTASP